MSAPAVIFEGVSKKFRRGERHDSLRDLIPSLVRRLLRPRPPSELEAEEFWAVRDVSFEVRPGEALGIIGPNGAGKSTILKLLTRILKPTLGRCEVRGRTGALIEVAAGFHPDLTGRENVYLQGAIMGMKRAEIRRRFDEIVDFAGVAEFIDTPVKRYSSGMNARLGFSIAAHLDPEVLIIDEVLSVGDMSFQQRCVDRMTEFKQRAAVVFVSHDLRAVGALCDRALLLVRGEARFLGKPDEAAQRYLESARSGATAEAASVRLVRAELRGPRGSDGTTFPAHAPCEVVATLECLEDGPDFNVGFVIERSADLLYCYGASSDSLGVPLLRCRRGARYEVRWTCALHFTRGNYRVGINARDPRGAVFLMQIDGVAQFTVDESVTYKGIADVGLCLAVTSAGAPSLAEAT
jgi:lipopolysaccharide transport system ATP-binding protein